MHLVTRIAEASAVRPHPRQVAWQRLGLTAFVHFGMNTMTDREWGAGHESPALFDPIGLDARQWIEALRAAEVRGVILTAKHHDGFCLWPGRESVHTVAASPWRDGRGDVVAEVAAACAAAGLRFGIYLSPWDRTEPTYGTGTPYDDHFVAQLTELLTGYGPIFSVWLDGANGEGPSGRVQRYDWDRYVATVRQLQPDAVVSLCGPDVRWCGNEAGATRGDEWSVVPASLRDAERIASRSQQNDDPGFSRHVRSDEEDLGSRDAPHRSEQPLVWYPAEVNTSIRPGWLHHPSEDGKVRQPDELFELWLRSVGGNANPLLNVPPTREGVIHEADVAALAGLGHRIRDFLARDVASAADIDAWTWRWDESRTLQAVVLEVNIEHGQQIDDIVVTGTDPFGNRHDLGHVHAVGARRVIRFPPAILREIHLDHTMRSRPGRAQGRHGDYGPAARPANERSARLAATQRMVDQTALSRDPGGAHDGPTAALTDAARRPSLRCGS